MWNHQLTQHIADAFRLMADPSAKKMPIDNSQRPDGVIQYRLANGALVSYSEQGESLKMTLSFPGGTVKIEVDCTKCRKCKAYLFPDKGNYCSHCGAAQTGGKQTTLDRRPWGMAESVSAPMREIL